LNVYQSCDECKDRLIQGVQRGAIPLTVALDIARAKDSDANEYASASLVKMWDGNIWMNIQTGSNTPERRKDLAPFEAKSLIHMVGVKGFEPSTPCTPCYPLYFQQGTAKSQKLKLLYTNQQVIDL